MMDLLDIQSVPQDFRVKATDVLRRIKSFADDRFADIDDIAMRHRAAVSRSANERRSIALAPTFQTVLAPHAHEQRVLRAIRSRCDVRHPQIEQVNRGYLHSAFTSAGAA